MAATSTTTTTTTTTTAGAEAAAVPLPHPLDRIPDGPVGTLAIDDYARQALKGAGINTIHELIRMGAHSATKGWRSKKSAELVVQCVAAYVTQPLAANVMATTTSTSDEEAELRPLAEDIGRLSLDDGEKYELNFAIDRAIDLRLEIQRLTLYLKGSTHKDCTWYDGPPVIGVEDTISALLEAAGERGVKQGEYDVYRMRGSSSRLSAPKLLTLGVAAEVIQAATTTTSYEALVVKQRSKGKGGKKQ